MQIRILDTQRAQDVRRFIQFPFDLYRTCPQWVPPFISEMAGLLNRDKHPFYRRSAAEFYLAENKGEVLGRLAVIDNRPYNEYSGDETALFYYFDSIDDIGVSRALFDAAFDWARLRGLKKVAGPKGMFRADALGLLVEGFEHLPAIGMPYNYAYYDTLVTDAGFEKEVDFVSGYLPGDYQLAPRFFEIAERVKERRGFAIKSFKDKAELHAWVPAIIRIYNDAFADTPGYYPVDEEEATAIADRLIGISDPRLIKLVLKGDEVVGFLFAFPDVSRALQKARGRLLPFGWWYLMRDFKRTDWVSVNGLGLLPQYQGLGANTILYTEMVKSVRDFHFQHGDVAQVAEDNLKSLGDMKALGVRWYKRHRVYHRTL